MSIWESLTSALVSATSYGELGSLGDIAFSVSAWNQIHTFDDLSRSAKVRTAQHDIIGDKPYTEYLGAGLQEISFKIKLNTQWGVNPAEEVKKLIAYCENGTVLTFSVGGKRIGNRWIIESVGESVRHYDNRGSILAVDVSLILKEYIVARVIPATV